MIQFLISNLCGTMYMYELTLYLKVYKYSFCLLTVHQIQTKELVESVTRHLMQIHFISTFMKLSNIHALTA